MIREESLRARYTEYKGREIVEPRYKKKDIDDLQTVSLIYLIHHIYKLNDITKSLLTIRVINNNFIQTFFPIKFVLKLQKKYKSVYTQIAKKYP